METLNYHHLLYFWAVVHEGGLVPAAKRLRVSHPTVSAQIKQLEESLGEPLFDRSRRKLQLTERGRLVFGYAEEIFSLGRELMDTFRGRPTGRPMRLSIGITDVMPKLIVREVLRPALELDPAPQLICREGAHDQLLAQLALHELDVVLSDAPLPAGAEFRAYSHLLGECGVSFCAGAELAAELEGEFPDCLDGAPMLLPTRPAALRRSLDDLFTRRDLRPEVVAEIDDSALLKVFGQDGLGVFAVPSAIEDQVVAQHRVNVIARSDELRESFYAISLERRLANPAVVAITEAARAALFAR